MYETWYLASNGYGQLIIAEQFPFGSTVAPNLHGIIIMGDTFLTNTRYFRDSPNVLVQCTQ